MVRILVTGAASGLGLDTATDLAEQGHDVVVHARNVDRLHHRRVLAPPPHRTASPGRR
ncbi:SDR family NAD(P)-dependent oxidoreductase [Tersicoccus phoenicis]|uniref:SDR family NAD(P)-dependent oxidoreductase n=1 Tax=Tersicoccus phoenicis TaxID=554083 RepID=UPI001180D971|nr:SDR family NAD(P)-dependent oxidoreductase [Tersicoccus phoenicis]